MTIRKRFCLQEKRTLPPFVGFGWMWLGRTPLIERHFIRLMLRLCVPKTPDLAHVCVTIQIDQSLCERCKSGMHSLIV
ncbi:hypothetical protein N7456_001192 [Penicillium angulare]|uniref:Uncharacterized protein n=1 Tax=Penicillium angulare TaxID=116970 RepID=A0A9W9GDJ4_9EURO|nr:hypothetical protein N7456_001192 [Penicillium angulare]